MSPCLTTSTLLAFCLLLVLLFFSSPLNATLQNNPTPAIVESIINAMNRSVDPCDDFYQYACGGWLANVTIPEDESQYTRSFTVIGEKNLQILLKVFQEEKDPMLQSFFSSCMDTDAMEAKGITDVVSLLTSIEELVQEDENMLSSAFAVTGYLHRLRITTFFELFTDADAKDPQTNIAQLLQGGLKIPKSIYANDTAEVQNLLSLYSQHMEKMFDLIHFDPALASKALKVEMKLASLFQSDEELSDPFASYNKYSFQQLQDQFPNLYFDSLMKGLIADPFKNANVMSVKYFSSLNELMKSFERDVIVAYLQWSALTAVADYSVKALREEHFNFFGKVIQGQSAQPERSHQCVNSASDSIGWLVGKYFVERSFPDAAKKLAIEVINNSQAAFKEILENNSWLDSDTRQAAQKKLSQITLRVGFPDKWPTYDDVEMHNDYFLNKVGFRWHEGTKMVESFDSPVNPSKWEMTPQTVNAYYSPTSNSQNFPAGILAQPYFSLDFPLEMNTGGFSFIASHEQSHSLDSSGRLYDGTGKLINWWTPESTEKFNERAQCLVNQYNNFCPLENHCVNGKNTLGENIADNNGLKTSFHALKMQIGDDEGHRPSIVDFLTRYQLFFTAFAQGWCAKSRPQEIIRRLEQDVHSPPEARVTCTLQNMEEFSEAFQCKSGARMNPENKCVIF